MIFSRKKKLIFFQSKNLNFIAQILVFIISQTGPCAVQNNIQLYLVETLKLQEMKFIGTEKEQSICRLGYFCPEFKNCTFFISSLKMTLNPRNKGRKSCINTRLTRSTLTCTKAYNSYLVPRRIWSWPVHQWSSRITITAILTWKI